METLSQQCPWCGSIIPHDKFVEIEKKIREQEKERLAEAEDAMRKKFLADTQALEEKAKHDAAKQVSKALADRNAALKKLKEAQEREAKIRNEVREEALLEKKAALKQADQQKQKELNEQRNILAASNAQILIKKQTEFARERETWQKKFVEMEHRLQKKTANEIGEGAETDLFEALREAFPRDTITRIKKGEPGADIRHDVLHKGEVCGTILYDSKNRLAWQNAYISKLRQDQLEAQADHAILTTTVFPSGKKDLCIEADVVVVNPARAVHITYLLRKTLVANHVLGLSLKERNQKTDRLYRFIISPIYTQRFEQVGKLTNEILEIEVQEQKTHNEVWKKRGALLTRQNNILREIDTEISAIIESTEDSALPAA